MLCGRLFTQRRRRSTKRTLKRIASFLISLTLVWITALWFSGKSQKQHNDDRSIHLASVVNSQTYLTQALVLLKSVLTQRGKYLSEGQDCMPISDNTLGPDCSFYRSTMDYKLHYHLFMDQETLLKAKSIVDAGWFMDTRLHFYQTDEYYSRLIKIPNRDKSGLPGLQKILIPELLPDNVKQVIILDTDVLFTYDIAELWDWFQLEVVDKNQYFAGVSEFNMLFGIHMKSIGWPLIDSGINTGLVLLNLAKLRVLNWTRLMDRTLENLLQTTNTLRFGAQELFNALFIAYSAYFVRLPCEWNVQLGHLHNQIPCGLDWAEEAVEKKECSMANSTQGGVIRMIHDTSQRKPEFLLRPFGMIDEDRTPASNLRRRFIQLYLTYRELPLNCFE